MKDAYKTMLKEQAHRELEGEEGRELEEGEVELYRVRNDRGVLD